MRIISLANGNGVSGSVVGGASSNNPPSLGRRRGITTRTTKSSLLQRIPQLDTPHSILILALICGTIFTCGLVFGHHVLGTPKIDNFAGDVQTGFHGHLKNAESSPLAAAMSNAALTSPYMQNLILESAKADTIEKKEEMEALKKHHGDTKMVGAHFLRGGVLQPGDANYNPHHHIDDAISEEYEKPNDILAEKNQTHDNTENMHNHFADALKHELDVVKQGEAKIVESMHNQFAQAVEAEHKAMDSIKSEVISLKEKAKDLLRGGGGSSSAQKVKSSSNVSIINAGELREGGGGVDLQYYPYMTASVPTDYDFQRYEPLGGNRFVEYKNGNSPYQITDKLITQSDDLARSRRYHVVAAMKYIWKNYKELAFGKDELHPISGSATSNWGGMGTTLVDALDTLWLMGLKDEFWEARDWVLNHLSHSHVGSVSVFETTIRSLGGLLSAYDLSRDDIFLKKADELGELLVKAYDTPSGLPRGSIDLQSGRSNNFSWNSNAYILAEVGTQQIEYRYLARASKKDDYAKKTEKVFDILHDMQLPDGLFFQNIQDGGKKPSFVGSKVSFGAMSDSVYEYLLKVWIQGGRKENMYREMWDKAMEGVHEKLVQKSSPNGLTYIADRNNGGLDRKMDHLACFMGGSLALSAYTDPRGLKSPRAQRDLKTAKALTYTCYQMYARTKTGIAPEYARFTGANDMVVPGDAPFYILRPETVEAFYYLSKLTGDPIYREWGWEVFQSIEKYCKTRYGYGSLKNVDRPDSIEDRMESFFLAETLKYLHLLFDPDSEIDILNKHVFNTEAHPLTIFEANK